MNRGLGLFAALTLFVRVAGADPTDGAQPAPPSSSFMTAMAPLLARWIEGSRDAALEQGVEKIPKSIRASLEGYVPDATLDRARWRTRGGGDLSLQESAFLLKDAQAITLDYVIVFANEDEARNDPKLWAHELRHVMQFEDWGIEGFATRYLADSAAVEDVASEYRWQFMKLRGLVPAPSVPSEP
jgi:uncharacterized protein DUF4157